MAWRQVTGLSKWLSPIQHYILCFNRGIVSKLGLARTDLKRLALSAEQQDNWMPRALGAMRLRPGLQKITQPYNNQRARYHSLVSSTDPSITGGLALLEFTPNALRVIENDVPVSRVAVSTAVTNGNFVGSLTGWTNADVGAGVSQWLGNGIVEFIGDGTNRAFEWQTVSVAGGDLNKVHGLRITVLLGKILVRIGSALDAQDFFEESTLGVGTHSIAFTPGGDAVVQIYNYSITPAWVGSAQIEPAGVMILPTAFSAQQLDFIRREQSADVVYFACNGTHQYKVEHRKLPTNDSWSIVEYQPDDGPFRVINTGETTLQIGALTGRTTLTSSAPGFFKPTHVGALFRIASATQIVSDSIAAQNTFTAPPVKVTGVGLARRLYLNIAGTFSATVTFQQSIGSATGPWTDIASYTVPINDNFDDGLDNQIVYYRFGIKTGDYTSGTAACTLQFIGGSISGVCRAISYASPTTINVIVLAPFGDTLPSQDWWEGQWSDYRGYPTCVFLHEGRLTWPGRGNYIASVSDGYESFDDTLTGDSAPISRTLGSGPIDIITWGVSLLLGVFGAQAAEWSARSDALTSALTPTNINLKDFSTQGSAPVEAIKVDRDAVFVQRSNHRVYLVELDNIYLGIYKSTDLTLLVPDLGLLHGGYQRIALQRSPDTRMHFQMEDGVVCVLLHDTAEDIRCWVTVTLRGSDVVEDVVTLPGDSETQVYYQTARVINGVTQRFLEKWAKEEDCYGTGARINPKLADCWVSGSNVSPATVLTGLDHLTGESVVVFADGLDQGGPYPVIGGSVTLPVAVSNWMAGLPYNAHFTSAKLAYGAQLGSALNQMKNVHRVGVVLSDTHAQGLQYGQDFDHLDNMPPVEDGVAVDPNSFWDEYDNDQFAFDGTWSTDSRICLYAAAPRPVTIEAVSIQMETDE